MRDELKVFVGDGVGVPFDRGEEFGERHLTGPPHAFERCQCCFLRDAAGIGAPEERGVISRPGLGAVEEMELTIARFHSVPFGAAYPALSFAGLTRTLLFE